MTDRYFIIDSDILVAENLTEEDFISYAYEMWVDDFEHKDAFEEPDDFSSAKEYLEYYYNILKGDYI